MAEDTFAWIRCLRATAEVYQRPARKALAALAGPTLVKAVPQLLGHRQVLGLQRCAGTSQLSAAGRSCALRHAPLACVSASRASAASSTVGTPAR
jgi:hypothetical protein